MDYKANPDRFNAMQKVKTAIYVVVGLYASYSIVFGTTFFNEFQRIMIFGAIISVVVIALFFWLGHTMYKNPKKIEN